MKKILYKLSQLQQSSYYLNVPKTRRAHFCLNVTLDELQLNEATSKFKNLKNQFLNKSEN